MRPGRFWPRKLDIPALYAAAILAAGFNEAGAFLAPETCTDAWPIYVSGASFNEAGAFLAPESGRQDIALEVVAFSELQ